MTYHVYKDWIIIDGRHYWTDHPRWARIVPGWVSLVPALCPNRHISLYPSAVLDPDGPCLSEVEPAPIGDGLRLSSPHLWVGSIVTELSREQLREVRVGCVGSLSRELGSIQVGGTDLDFGYRCVPDAAPGGSGNLSGVW